MAGSRIILMVFFVLSATSVKCQVKESNTRLNLKDSISVSRFILNSSTCAIIELVLNKTNHFVSGKGYSELILQSITKETNSPLFLAIANGSMHESRKSRMHLLRQQVIEIKQMFNCKN